MLPSVVYHPDCVPNHFTPEAALFTVNKKNNNKNKYRHVQSDQRVRLNPANDRLTLVCGGFLSLPHLLLHHDAVEQWVGVPASHPHRNVPCHLSEPESSGGLQHVSPNLRSQTCVGFFSRQRLYCERTFIRNQSLDQNLLSGSWTAIK